MVLMIFLSLIQSAWATPAIRQRTEITVKEARKLVKLQPGEKIISADYIGKGDSKAPLVVVGVEQTKCPQEEPNAVPFTAYLFDTDHPRVFELFPANHR